MNLHTLLVTTILCIAPISELRGGLPFALSQGVHFVWAYLFCVAVNSLVGPLLHLFLTTLHKLLSRWNGYQRLFEGLVERARLKVKAKVDKYGYWGIVMFVAIPLPITGVYTGTLGAWVLGLDAKKTSLAVLLGAALAGLIVTAVYYLVVDLGLNALRFFIKAI